jgi:hypothetical protein
MSLAATEFPNRTRLEAYARQYHLVLPERQRASLCGDLTGRRTGSSVEYQDRKDYVPGDDVRHVDWRAYARNDRLTIKLYREEISPRVDIFVDTSLSISVTDEKALRRTELAYLFALLARKMHAATRVWNLGEQLERVPDPMALLSVEEKRQDTPLPLLMGSGAARGGGIKILISDLLFPCAPPDLAAAFAQATGRCLFKCFRLLRRIPPRGRRSASRTLKRAAGSMSGWTRRPSRGTASAWRTGAGRWNACCAWREAPWPWCATKTRSKRSCGNYWRRGW